MSVSLHILAADDEPDVSAYLRDYLTGLGHRVAVASNGVEALNAIGAAHREQDAFHLLLIDARMPVLDGVSLVRELRRGRDPTDIAFMTGDEQLLPTLDQEAQHLGCLMVLTKPFDPAQIVQLVEFVALRRGRRISSGGGATQTIHHSSALVRNDAPAAAPAPVAQERDEYAPSVVPPPPPAAPPTSTTISGDARIRRSQVFYPEPPAGAPTVSQRTPLPGSRTPLPGNGAGTGTVRRDGGLTGRIGSEGRVLPPVPAPVAQPPPRDFRTPSRLTPLDPPPLSPALDPTQRRTPRPPVAPPVATPPAPVQDPRRSSTALPPLQTPRPLPPPQLPPTGTTGVRPSTVTGQRPPTVVDPNESGGRLRRTVGGSQAPPSAMDASAARMLACAHCGGTFRAVLKPQSYNLVCVHCGKLNRIDP